MSNDVDPSSTYESQRTVSRSDLKMTDCEAMERAATIDEGVAAILNDE